jgi:hypothetical protein
VWDVHSLASTTASTQRTAHKTPKERDKSVAWFVIRMASGDSITVDGEFTIGPENGVLTVVRAQQPRAEITTHFSPTAWVSVETMVQQPAGVPVHATQPQG